MVHGTYNGFFQRVLELRCASQINNAHGLDYLKAPVRKHNRVDFAVDFAVKVALLSAMDKSPNLVPVLLLGEGHGPADFETVDNILWFQQHGGFVCRHNLSFGADMQVRLRSLMHYQT